MQPMEVAKSDPATAEDRLLALARKLSGMRQETLEPRGSARHIAAGLSELSVLAQDCGQLRVSKACKALSVILGRLEQGQEEDTSFILSTALNFLDAIQARRVTSSGGNL